MMSNNLLNSTNRYVALDVETTGFSPQNGDRVIEIGAVAIEDHSIVDEFSSLIDAGKRIPWQVQQVHGKPNRPKPLAAAYCSFGGSDYVKRRFSHVRFSARPG